MLEVDQKIVEMSYDEFKKWDVPQGYKVMRMSGEETVIWSRGSDSYFNIRVVLQKI